MPKNITETYRRTFVKSVGWRLLSFSGTALILWIYGKPTLQSLIEAMTISIGAVGLYFVYERLWLHIDWGVKSDTASH